MSKLDDQVREQERVAKERERFKSKARAEGWQKYLRLTANRKEFRGDYANVFIAFEHHPELQGLVRYNELTRRIELQRAPPWRTLTPGSDWLDDDDVDLANLLQCLDIPVNSEKTVSRVVHSVAGKNSFHPVRDWLRTLKWDGEPRIKDVLIEVLGASGNGEYLGGVLRRFLISAVARVMRPGCKADHMLVLVGSQGVGKSTFAQVLGAPWTVESNSQFGTKDAIQELEGAWIIEVGELSSLSRSRIEVMNHFVSRVVDHYRQSYGRSVVNQLRSCVFLGTTNEIRFLRDYTGNRRFWPIVCGQIDLRLLRDNLAQLWAEAVAAYDAGEQWYLTKAEEKLAASVQEEHRVVSEVEEDVRLWLERCLEATPQPITVTTVNEVYEAICGEHERHNIGARRQLETSIGHAMRRAGWVCIGRRGKYRRTTYQFVAEATGDNIDNLITISTHRDETTGPGI
jgi:predicted P-loop ATPase